MLDGCRLAIFTDHKRLTFNLLRDSDPWIYDFIGNSKK
jgi:hypothetical protein